jgi:hypothetical protein
MNVKLYDVLKVLSEFKCNKEDASNDIVAWSENKLIRSIQKDLINEFKEVNNVVHKEKDKT